MGLEKVAFNFVVARGEKLTKSLLCSKPQTVQNIHGLKYIPKIETNCVSSMVNQPVCDIFAKFFIDDIYDIINLGNGKIRLVPKVHSVNGKIITSFSLPEYLYHITSETNLKSILQANKLKVSANEQLPGVYLFDSENLLARYLDVGDRHLNLLQELLMHANKSNKNSSDLVFLRIPTENLLKNGRLRIRTQEDFFHYQDRIKELQDGLKDKFPLRALADDNYRTQFEKHVIENKLMTKKEFDQFMDEMKQKIHYGYTIDMINQLENDYAVEYIFNKDICPNLIRGIKVKRFSLNDCLNTETGILNIEELKALLS